jgi:hypothetical protein
MPVTPSTAGPYAPAAGILGIVNRYRSKGLPSPIDGDVLARAGVSPSLTPRTLQALHTLDLLNDDGSPSDILEGLRLAPESEYQQRMADWLNAAYADALVYIDPAEATEVQIRDAFRSYKPVGQQDRMVSLFMSLFAAAGVRAEKEKQPQRKAPGAASSAPRVAPKPKPPAPRQQSPAGSVAAAGVVPAGVVPGAFGAALPPAVAGLLASLPKDGEGWTQVQRDKFLLIFEAITDFCFPIIEPDGETNTADGQ